MLRLLYAPGYNVAGLQDQSVSVMETQAGLRGRPSSRRIKSRLHTINWLAR
jgi:hypothetical protein